MADPLAVALEYAAAGLAVFPARVRVEGGRKVVQPIGRWRDTSSRSPDTIRSWFAPGEPWADASLCIDCGKSKLVVVDLDVADGKDGPATWTRLVDEHDIPITRAVCSTPSGGQHWYYREHERRVVGIDSSGKVAPGVDVRGLGGFVIAAPSEDSRGAYGPLDLYALAIAPNVPEFVIERMTRREDSEPPAATTQGARGVVAPSTGAAGKLEDSLSIQSTILEVRQTGVALDDETFAPRLFTRREAEQFVKPTVDALRAAAVGAINHRLNDAAKTVSHFIPAIWSRAEAERGLMTAVGHTAYDAKTWRAEATIASAFRSAAGDWKAVERPAESDAAATESPAAGDGNRRVDLGPWLDGSYVPPQPDRGAIRDDNRRLLYPGRWHNVDAPTETGKTWLAIAHARDELLNARRTVAYIHFEEELPGGTIERLLAIGLDRELIRSRFVWLSNERPWDAGDLAGALADIDDLGLVVLDGRNAACTRHGQDVSLVETVGWFRARFVAPATRLGAAVLSLGHPPKARDRQDERHGYGSTAWLDEIDGVAFRLTAGSMPVNRGAFGMSALHVVKDRYGEVSRLCLPDSGRDGWRYAGSLVVDDMGRQTTIRLAQPAPADVSGAPTDPIDQLADSIACVLGEAEGQRYGSERELRQLLLAGGVAVRKDTDDLGAALSRLERAGRLGRGPQIDRRARPGFLVPTDPTTEVQDHD